MATDKQIEANRLNAQKCRGPVTPAGLAISSQNALKHGLDSKSEVMRAESQQAYEALIAAFYEQFNPTVPEDRTLVDMMIKADWLHRRYFSIDAGLWERGFIETDDMSLGRVFERSDKTFERIGRRLNWAQRNYQSALKQLLEIRSKRANAPAAQPFPQAEPESSPELPAETQQPSPVDVVTEALSPELDSFLPDASESPISAPPVTFISVQPAEIVPEAPAHHPEKELDPPIAA